MIRRNRPKQVMVENVKVLSIIFSSVLHVGDVHGDCRPFSYAEAYGGPRGAGSFTTEERAVEQLTRLHYANRLDEDIFDSNKYGEDQETFRPNIRGVKSR